MNIIYTSTLTHLVQYHTTSAIGMLYYVILSVFIIFIGWFYQSNNYKMSSDYTCSDYINQTNNKPTGCLIFLHGFGKTGEWQKNQFEELLGSNAAFPHIKIIFPTAPQRPDRNMKHSWFNFVLVNSDHINRDWEGDEKELQLSKKFINNLIDDAIQSGIPADRILLGGVSQGGCMAMICGYTSGLIKVKGIISLSGTFPGNYRKKLRLDSELPEMFFAHYREDLVIPYENSKAAYDFFINKGVRSEYFRYDKNGHEIDQQMLKDVYEWILKMIPENLEK